jgi:hypothetical protein
MDNGITLPEIILPDYSNVLSDTPPVIPDKYEQQYSASELIAKVKRKIIKGRVDGN